MEAVCGCRGGKSFEQMQWHQCVAAICGWPAGAQSRLWSSVQGSGSYAPGSVASQPRAQNAAAPKQWQAWHPESRLSFSSPIM